MSNDLLTGGPGKSNFVLRYGMGSDVIRDFGFTYYKATLIDDEVIPANVAVSSAKGTALIGLARNEQSAVVHLEVKGLTSAATDADIYFAWPGYTGPSALDIPTPAATAFSVNASWSNIATGFYNSFLKNGQLNATVATSNFPGGEIRGQFQVTPIDAGVDTIDLRSVNIASMATVRELVSEAGGNARITLIRNGEKSSFTLKGVSLRDLTEADFKFSASNSKNSISGTKKVDTLCGGGGNDTLKGLAGNDLLFGEFGNDVITGGLGQDDLWGGRGKDRFDFNSVKDSGKTSSTRDVIHDFDRTDILDLRDIDANGSGVGNGKFTLGFGKSFSGKAGDLRFYLSSDSHGPITIVAGDINGDKKADFQIELDGRVKFHSGDIIL